MRHIVWMVGNSLMYVYLGDVTVGIRAISTLSLVTPLEAASMIQICGVIRAAQQ